MDSDYIDSDQKDFQTKPKSIYITPINEWKTGQTQKGEVKYSKRIDTSKWVHVGFYKTGRAYICYNGSFIKDHGIKTKKKDYEEKSFLQEVDKVIEKIN